MTAAFGDVPDEFLMVGHYESSGRTSPFIIAITKERSFAGSVGGYGSASFFYSGAHERRVQIDWPEPFPVDLKPRGVEVSYVLLSDHKNERASDGYLKPVGLPGASQFNFGVMLQSDYVGISTENIRNNDTYRNKCGVLRVQRTSRGAIKTITFDQEESDLLTVRLPDQTLAQTTHPYKAGRKSMSLTTSFTPPFDQTSQQWMADCSWTCVTKDNQTIHNTYRVVVDEFSRDLKTINQRIDEYLALIPNGFKVRAVGDDPISYIWRDGKVVRNLGNAATAIAAEAEFKSSSSQRWLWLTGLLILVALLAIFWIRRKPEASS